MRLPVDTSVVHFVPAGPAEPSIDFDTKQPKTDAKGVAINQVHLFVVGDGGTREVITVKVSGDVKGLGQFTPVKVADLVALTWTMADRSGVLFSASRIEAITPRISADGHVPSHRGPTRGGHRLGPRHRGDDGGEVVPPYTLVRGHGGRRPARGAARLGDESRSEDDDRGDSSACAAKSPKKASTVASAKGERYGTAEPGR